MTERRSEKTFTDIQVLEILKEFKERWEGADLPKMNLLTENHRIDLAVAVGPKDSPEYLSFVKYMHFNDKWALFWSPGLEVTISTKLGLKLYFENITR